MTEAEQTSLQQNTAEVNDQEVKKNETTIDSNKESKPVVEKVIVAARVTGVVKWFNVKNGYGFVTRDDTNEDVFVHQTSIAKNNPKKIKKSVGEGEKIEFDIVKGERTLMIWNFSFDDGLKWGTYARPKEVEAEHLGIEKKINNDRNIKKSNYI